MDVRCTGNSDQSVPHGDGTARLGKLSPQTNLTVISAAILGSEHCKPLHGQQAGRILQLGSTETTTTPPNGSLTGIIESKPVELLWMHLSACLSCTGLLSPGAHAHFHAQQH